MTSWKNEKSEACDEVKDENLELLAIRNYSHNDQCFSADAAAFELQHWIVSLSTMHAFVGWNFDLVVLDGDPSCCTAAG